MASNWLRAAEFLLWVVVVGGLVSAGAVGVGYLIGGTLVAAKYAVFLVGVALFGLGSIGIQPTPSYKEKKRVTMESAHQNRLEAKIQEIPPLRGRRLPFDQRVGRNAKVFVTGLFVLAVSLVMEVGLGIRV
ncbi:DUF7555 family protein [Halosimplex salinum]|uniref:DUF7555 family protein n=1 Tax=Halosimplex salinum TaxID=1710538 RepID=UPI000F491ED7|nr:hypothetical protein [Halosimplex salinum]